MTEVQQDAVYAAYLGICVLQRMCRAARLKLAETRAKELLVEMGTAFPFLTERIAKSALRVNSSVDDTGDRGLDTGKSDTVSG